MKHSPGGVRRQLTTKPFSGRIGYDGGTLMMPARRPARPAISQSVGARRSLVLARPGESYRSGASRRNAKTPWAPGFRPVVSEDHAGSVSAGTVERSVPQLPRAMSPAR